MKSTEYYETVSEQLARQFAEEEAGIQQAATLCAESVKSDRLIHVFGCGHSQMFAMEVFYRAGGLVPVNALLTPHLSLAPQAELSTFQERIEGFSGEYLRMQNTDAADTMIIVSISGRNPAVVDMALAAQQIGMKVVALVSDKFARATASRHSSGKNLRDVADVVIDIKCIAGDAVLQLDGLEPRFCGTSTVLGMAVMEAIMAQTVENCVAAGVEPPLYVSANLDEGDASNARWLTQYRPLISNL